MGESENDVVVGNLPVCRLGDCFRVKHKVDVDEVVDHLGNGLPFLVNAEVFLYALDVTFKIPKVNEKYSTSFRTNLT